jgi:peptide/nickel transport system permease protein
MTRYLLRRLVLIVPVLLMVTIGIFSLIHLTPGDPLTAILGEERADAQVMAVLRARMGLDEPIPIQYLRWIERAVRGDLGYSFHLRQPVAQALGDRLPVTLQLALFSVVLSLLLAVPLGIVSATRRGSWLDLLSSSLAALGSSMPAFWLGVLLILAFAEHLRVLPPYGYVRLKDDLVGNLKAMIQPSLTLAAAYTAMLSRLVRASLLDVLGEDYVRTSRSKGLAERVVIMRHAVRSSLLPIITVIGMESGRLLGGAIVTETIFVLPGVGRLAVDSVLSRDLPTLQGVTLFMAAALMICNLIADLTYGLADPRISYE